MQTFVRFLLAPTKQQRGAFERSATRLERLPYVAMNVAILEHDQGRARSYKRGIQKNTRVPT